MNAEQARALLAQGKKDGTFEAPIPEDDTKAISEANDLVEMAQTAWDQMVRGPEVEVLLRMAAENGDGDGEAPKKAEQNGGGQKHEPEPDPEPQSEPEPTPEEPKAETPPEPQQNQDGDDLAKVEPWEGYDKEKVSDIKVGVNAAVRDYDEGDLTELMTHVWTYESAHKGRATILDHLESVAAKLQTGQDLDPDPPDSGDDDDPAEDLPEAESQTEPDPTPEPTPDPEPEADADEGGDGSGTEGSDGSDPDPTPDLEQKEEPVEEPVEEKPKRHEQKSKEKEPEEDLDDYQRLIGEVEENLKRERVHTPKAPEEEIPDLPWDWTKMSNETLQKLHGIYSALAYYKGYQMSRDERIALLCKAAADEMHNDLLVAAEKYDDHGKEKRVATLEAEIESDDNVVLWRRRQRKHETFAASHRNERDSVGKLVDALSRHESMRHQEWERTTKSGGGRK